MVKKEDFKLTTSNLEEMYFLKKNTDLIKEYRSKNKRKDLDNVTPLFSAEKNKDKTKKAA